MAQQAIVAVLAGGRGRRLGGAKAMAPLAGRALIAYPLAAARAASLQAVVIAKPDTPLPPLAETVIREAPSPAHPLCGALAALEHARTLTPPAPAVVLVACDMPFLTGELLAWLGGLQGAALAQLDGRLQPLLSRLLPEHSAMLERALAAASPLGGTLASLAPRIVDERELSRFGAPERLCFSVNDGEDMRRAEGWLV